MKFNNLSHEEKLNVQKEIIDCMDNIGGRNYFLSMIENIRESKQFPLLNKTGKYHFENGTILWGKEIFKDKLITLMKDEQSEFFKSITEGTSSKGAIETRFRIMNQMIKEVIDED